MFEFLIVLCLTGTNQCMRLEAEAPTMAQCEVLRKDAIAKTKDAYIGECVEIDVD